MVSIDTSPRREFIPFKPIEIVNCDRVFKAVGYEHIFSFPGVGTYIGSIGGITAHLYDPVEICGRLCNLIEEVNRTRGYKIDRPLYANYKKGEERKLDVDFARECAQSGNKIILELIKILIKAGHTSGTVKGVGSVSAGIARHTLWYEKPSDVDILLERIYLDRKKKEDRILQTEIEVTLFALCRELRLGSADLYFR